MIKRLWYAYTTQTFLKTDGWAECESPGRRAVVYENIWIPWRRGSDHLCLQRLLYLGRILYTLRKYSLGERMIPSKSVRKSHTELGSTGMS